MSMSLVQHDVYSGFRGVAGLGPPRTVSGDCLRSFGFIPGRCLTWHDARVPPRDGDFVSLRLVRDGEPPVDAVKILQCEAAGWFLVSDEGATQLSDVLPFLETMEVLVLRLTFAPEVTDWQVAHFPVDTLPFLHTLPPRTDPRTARELDKAFARKP